jgi:hypothetical protein
VMFPECVTSLHTYPKTTVYIVEFAGVHGRNVIFA